MIIAVRYFAAARERAGTDREEIALEPGATVAAVLAALVALHPALGPLLPHLRVAVDRAFVSGDAPVPSGAEVALIPPVAGGAPLRALRPAPLSLDEAVRAVSGPGRGGVVTFSGAVRAESRGRRVIELTYEAYPEMAERTLDAIAQDAEARFGARVAVLHRVGVLQVGELAVVIAAAAPHRAAAFDACRFTIDRLKQDVPIWKKERYLDGEAWVGLGP